MPHRPDHAFTLPQRNVRARAMLGLHLIERDLGRKATMQDLADIHQNRGAAMQRYTARFPDSYPDLSDLEPGEQASVPTDLRDELNATRS